MGNRRSPYLRYNELSREDRLLFAHSGIDRIIRNAARILSGRIGSVETYRLEQPYFSTEDIFVITDLISQLLGLIGRHSNLRYGRYQNAFFKRPSERETFPYHLYASRFANTRQQLIKRAPRNAAKLKANGKGTPAYSPKLFRGISGAGKIRFGRSKMNEAETRAVGSLYMINLMWETLQEAREAVLSGDATCLSRVCLMALELQSLWDSADRIVSLSKGGKKGNKKQLRFEEAEEMVKEIVDADSDVETEFLSQRAKLRLKRDLEDTVPSERWIKDKIRKIKKAHVATSCSANRSPRVPSERAGAIGREGSQ
jgi:hypothetical protein